LLKVLCAALLGIVLGLGVTWSAVERGYRFNAVDAGPWTSFPRNAYADAEPYARAAIARSGEIPLSLAEGLSFIARQDEAGRPLDARCDYIITSPIPAARFWTLTPMTPDGGLIANDVGRFGVTSAEIVRDGRGRFEIVASSQARAGAWLPLTSGAPFVFMLRLYDTPSSAAATSLTADQMPGLQRGACS
jgi:hypothetical protein